MKNMTFPMRTRKKSTINDVARHAGVSTTTISYFVNGRTSVCSQETALRIRDAIDQLHYTPNSLTKGLRQKRTNTVGISVINPLESSLQYSGSYFERLWRGILEQADIERLSLLHYPSAIRDNADIGEVVLDGRVDGVLFHTGQDAHIRRVAAAGLPAVLIDRAAKVPTGVGAVYSDARATVDLALTHLWELGHRRIAHIAGPIDTPSGAESRDADDLAVRRCEAYSNWMRARSAFDTRLIGRAGSWQQVTDTSFFEKWDAIRDPPTAVFCANDAIALSFIAQVRQRGHDVPSRFSVVGVDDSESARTSDPPLTSVRIPVEEIGRQSLRTLLRLQNGSPIDLCRVAVPVTQLVVRQSTRAI